MKRRLLFFVLAFASLSAFSQGSMQSVSSATVSPARAKAVAARLLRCDSPVEVVVTGDQESLSYAKARQSARFTPYYIYNSERGEGFAIVSGDSRFPSVLGYSDKGSFPADGNVSPALAEYLDFCSQYMTDVRVGDVPAPRGASSVSGTPVVTPLLTTKWGQDAPYNMLCPKAGKETCYVGCVATAMAQIMKFWNWPEHGRGLVSYTHSDFGQLQVNFENSYYDWANMYNTALQNSKGEARKNAVSKLSYDCGVASRMDYSTSGSGTTIILARIALGRNLGYAASKMNHVYRDCFDGTQEDYNNIIYTELNAGRPILYAGFSSKGGGKDAGHCYVFDGYDSDGLVHVNWGWDGSGDGYYAIPLLNPDGTGYEFTEQQEMVYGIEPDRQWNDSKEDQVPLRMLEKQVAEREIVALGSEFNDTIKQIFNWSGNQRGYYISVGLFDLDGKLVEIVGNTNNGQRVSLPYYSGYSSYPVPCKISSTCKDGQYGLRVVCREFHNPDDYEWVLPYTLGGQINDWLPVVVKGGKAYFNSPDGPVAPTAIESLNTPVSVSSYDLTGKLVVNPAKGTIIINKVLMNDGSVKTTKTIAR